MRIGNLSDRLVLVTDTGAIDVEKSSAGRLGADPQAVYERWHEFRDWAAAASTDDAVPFRLDELGPPAPRPAQVFAVGRGGRRPDTRSQNRWTTPSAVFVTRDMRWNGAPISVRARRTCSCWRSPPPAHRCI